MSLFFTKNEIEVADSAVLRRDYILHYADGRDSTVVGGQHVYLLHVSYIHGDTAKVEVLKRGPGRAAGTNLPMVDDGGSQQWRFIYVGGAWVGEMTQIVTN